MLLSNYGSIYTSYIKFSDQLVIKFTNAFQAPNTKIYASSFANNQ